MWVLSKILIRFRVMRYCIFSRDDERSQKMSFEISSFLEKDAFFSLDEASPELVIVIGGDGTFLT